MHRSRSFRVSKQLPSAWASADACQQSGTWYRLNSSSLQTLLRSGVACGTQNLDECCNRKCHIYCIQIEGHSAMDRGNLAHLTAFVAVVDRLSIQAAASQLGVNRTTRSVSVTDAGSGSWHCLYIAPQK
jgi:hypothetical protein